MTEVPEQQNVIDELQRLGDKVVSLEEHHNEVVDLQARTKDISNDYVSFVKEAEARLLKEIASLMELVEARLDKVYRMKHLLSVVAMTEELGPVMTRVNHHNYEYYASPKWFSQELASREAAKKAKSSSKGRAKKTPKKR